MLASGLHWIKKAPFIQFIKGAGSGKSTQGADTAGEHHEQKQKAF
jgi:hypothetical protein